MTPQILLDVDVRALAVRVRMNDVLVLDSETGQPERAAMRLGGWAIPGGNRLTIQWRPPRPGFTGGERKLVARVRRTAGETETELGLLEWSAADPPLGEKSFGLAFEPPDRWRWIEAEVFSELPGSERSAILALLGRVREALATRDSDWLVTAQTLQLSEQARAVGTAPPQMIASYRSFLSERLPGNVVDPIEPNTLRLELMGGGRIVRVSSTDDSPAVMSRSAEGVFAMTPYLAKIGGAWAIVR